MAELLEFGFGHDTVDVPIVTTAETLAIATEIVQVSTPTARVLLQGFAQITTGASVTAVTPRIRRGNGVAGAIVDDAIAISLGAAAGGNETFVLYATDDLANIDQIQWSLTLQQTGATGNGTILQMGLVAWLTT